MEITFKKKIRNLSLNNLPLKSSLVTNTVSLIQQGLEEGNYSIRKNLFAYDRILNRQRRLIYQERNLILNAESLKPITIGYGEQVIIKILDQFKKSQVSFDDVLLIFENLFGDNFLENLPFNIRRKSENQIISLLYDYFIQEFWVRYESKILEYNTHNKEPFHDIERSLLLSYIDMGWKNLLQDMDSLRDIVLWRSYGDRNPLFEYEEEAVVLFKNNWTLTQQLIVHQIIRVPSSLIK